MAPLNPVCKFINLREHIDGAPAQLLKRSYADRHVKRDKALRRRFRAGWR